MTNSDNRSCFEEEELLWRTDCTLNRERQLLCTQLLWSHHPVGAAFDDVAAFEASMLL